MMAREDCEIEVGDGRRASRNPVYVLAGRGELFARVEQNNASPITAKIGEEMCDTSRAAPDGVQTGVMCAQGAPLTVALPSRASSPSAIRRHLSSVLARVETCDVIFSYFSDASCSM